MTPRERRYWWTRYYYDTNLYARDRIRRSLWRRMRDYVTACWLTLAAGAGE